MMRFCGCVIAVVLTGVASAMLPEAANAQQPRTRTLTYDPDRKTWTEVPPPPSGTAEGDLHAIQVQIKNGEYRSALTAIKGFIKRYGDPCRC